MRALISAFRPFKQVERPERTAPLLSGTLHRFPEVGSRYLAANRNVIVYLPPGYAGDTGRRYPVLYLQDGQNLFDPRTSFIPGQDWRLGETVERLLASNAIEPLVIVGIDNSGPSRIDEYAPTYDVRRNAGGQADPYGSFLAEELKPFVDSSYRTRPGPADTGLGGSSLGGLASLYLGLTNPQLFGRLAILSPSLWWDDEVMARRIAALAGHLPLRIWLDVGTKEGGATRGQVRRVRDLLVAKGWKTGVDLGYFEARGAGHNERAWGERAGRFLRFLFPPDRSRQTRWTGRLRRIPDGPESGNSTIR